MAAAPAPKPHSRVQRRQSDGDKEYLGTESGYVTANYNLRRHAVASPVKEEDEESDSLSQMSEISVSENGSASEVTELSSDETASLAHESQSDRINQVPTASAYATHLADGRRENDVEDATPTDDWAVMERLCKTGPRLQKEIANLEEQNAELKEQNAYLKEVNQKLADNLDKAKRQARENEFASKDRILELEHSLRERDDRFLKGQEAEKALKTLKRGGEDYFSALSKKQKQDAELRAKAKAEKAQAKIDKGKAMMESAKIEEESAKAVAEDERKKMKKLFE